MLRRDIATLLLASAAGAALPRQSQAQSSCPSLLVPGADAPNYPQTYAEFHAQPQVVPSNQAYPPGSVLRYGADPCGVTSSDAAFNQALRCNALVFDDFPGGGTYIAANPITFQRDGQILKGQGFGEGDTSCGTCIKWVGTGPGPLISFSDGTKNYDDCVLEGFFLDGAGTANIGVELYNDSITGGNWRNTIRKCSIWNITAGTNASAIYGGLLDAAPSFANDAMLEGVFISNTARGISGNGAVYRLIACSIAACSDAGIHTGPGSFWNADGCVFSSNNRDFDGSNIQQFTATGCWFENSAVGIYRAATAHSLCLTGCFLHTFDTTAMMDFGDAAGYHMLNGNYIPAGTRSQNIINVNSSAVGAAIGQAIPMFYSGTGAEVPLILPAAQTGTGAVRSVSATLTSGQQLVLSLGRGTFFVGVDIWWTQSGNVRSQATYSAFLFDGDNEAVIPIASHTGSGGAQSYTLVPSVNSLTLTYTGSQTVSAYLSGAGVVG